MIQEEKRKRNKAALAALITLGANLLFFLMVFLASRYDNISLDQLLYQMQTSISGTNSDFAASAVLTVGGLGTLTAVLEIAAYWLLSGAAKGKLPAWKQYANYCAGKTCRFFSRRALPMSLMLLLIACVSFGTKLEVFDYVGSRVTESDFIEENYADPSQVALTFPEKKRNLVYIYLESMENTFADSGACDTIVDNYIPELTQLAESYVNFSDTDGLGGARSFDGTTWTAAALVTQTSGVPVKVSLIEEEYGQEDVYMPGIVTLGDVLEDQGYEQVFIMGSNGEFANRDTYFTTHGNYQILDTNALKAAGRLPQDYEQWWGYEDEKLFAYAKEELTRLSQTGEPFNLTLLTADSHFPDGYVCRLCGEDYEQQYANVLRCSAAQVYEFITWLQQQPCYENTTIVLSGDHLTMDPEFLADIDKNYVRTVYNCIINAPVTAANEKQRQFGTFDMFPTTLAALGVQIEGERLGLGTNLFSDTPTLTELYGFEALNEELQKKSEYYDTKFFGKEE